MPPVDRKNPVRAKSSWSSFSLMEFMREFPDDDACLEYLWQTKHSPDGTHAHCQKCDRERVFKRYKTGQQRQSWTCTGCGLHVHPTAGTIFHKSSTSLQLWFYAMYLMTSTRCGVSAKHLERELGVTYKTAWRMANKIRMVLMDESDDEPLSGIVEIDETSIEGRPRKHLPPRGGEAARYRERSRATVFAAVERGGRIKATVLPSRRGPRLAEQAIEWVRAESVVMTDEWPAYNRLGDYFIDHSRVIHSAREYARGNTNTVEGFFGNLKTGIRGNYKKVSRRWLQGYLNEFCWRYNRRRGVGQAAMFRQLVHTAAHRSVG